MPDINDIDIEELEKKANGLTADDSPLKQVEEEPKPPPMSCDKFLEQIPVVHQPKAKNDALSFQNITQYQRMDLT